MRRTLVALCALGLVAGACTSSGDDQAQTVPSTTTTATDSSVGATTTGTEPVDSTTAAPLTASFRGVTSDTITVGVSYVDLEAVFDIVGLDHGDYQLAFQVVIDRINDQGGINGRQIEAVYESVDPIGTDPATEACIRLTEDQEVFAVMGQFLDETPLCYVETHDTALIGGDITTELLGRATAPWFASNASPDRLNTDILQAFIDAGELDGAVVGVVADAVDQNLVESVVVPTLAGGGIEPVEVAYLEDTGGDESASDAQVAVITERFDNLGADTVVVIDAASVAFLGGLEDVTYRPMVVSTNLGNMRVYIRDDADRDLSVLEGAVAGNQAEQLIWWQDPAIQDCIDLIEAADPDQEIYDPATRTDDQPENIVSIFTACHTVALFEAIATAAGPELTNESFVAAGEALGTIVLPGIGEARFGPAKHDGAESIYLYRWSDEAQDLVSDGVPL